MAAETDILPPRYRGPRQIGRGGMGEIYRATDTVLGRDVAVKVLAERYAEEMEVRSRFTREALAAARLSGHPHAVTIFDVGECHGRPFIVMEYLPGGSLETRIRAGAQPPARALVWLEQAAEALDAGHREGVVHRDVKPANLLLDAEDAVHVADFGIASAAGLDSLTQPGTVLGTAGYLAPEQARGERSTPASDLYALAVVAFELLTGDRPFASDSATAEAAAHVNAPVPRISERNGNLPQELDAVFAAALAKDAAERPRSCREFVAELREALATAAGETTPHPALVPPTRPVPVPARRRRALWPLLLAALLLGVAGAVAAVALSRNGAEEALPPTTDPAVATTLVTTIVTTAPGTTQQVTVTAEAPAPPPPEEEEPAEEPEEPEQPEQPVGGGGSVNDGIALTDESTGMIRGGRYEEALPVAQRALELLTGSGHIYEAYANYNVGKSLLEVGRCGEALPYFDRSEAIQGQRSEIQRDRAAARQCA